MQTQLIETGVLQRSLEALLFVASESLSIERLVKLTGAEHIDVAATLQRIGDEYAERGLVLREVAGGYRFATSPAARPAVEAYLMPAKTTLSAAAMESLAIVAYQQPCTRAEIEAVRGVNVDGVVGTLVDRRFIAESGRREVPGRPMEYSTTAEFLEAFGLRSLSELPPVAQDAAPLEPELPVAMRSGAVRASREPDLAPVAADTVATSIQEAAETVAVSDDPADEVAPSLPNA
jgi:segregation and condensation protein B